ncbi:GNAT family N-acetyltransferase [Rummeliibacillus suwonensis]|jgi:ribosomal-protein-serine acetyltransferase|uniref:GNAT family N-acetyltransferase n=1 Tax=Rummeliibacillus suwonensis TaxID=1306154 RepID=UPI0011B73649|nr:GNAT family protein [Rummeliibacillus suwonensis]MBO2537159.1 GNAT family N-acetyltransferase [Rummeliibacillus suwonensis]
MIKISDELLLRPVTIEDANILFTLTDKDRLYLREWLPWVDTTKTVEDSKNYIISSQKGEKAGTLLNFVIIWKGKIVGISGFNEIDRNNRITYIGYWLSSAYQGNGIMTQAAKALTDYAFVELHMNKVEIRAAVGNQKSRSIPQRLGYTEEGILRSNEWLYDHFVDHVVYSILADEWRRE